jgi:hypothetical protein
MEKEIWIYFSIHISKDILEMKGIFELKLKFYLFDTV